MSGMLKILFGSAIRGKIYLYLITHGECHAREIAAAFKTPPISFAKQLNKLEGAGLLISRRKGRTKLYAFNPRYPFRIELTRLLEKILRSMPDQERRKYGAPPSRPRPPRKPL
jgi:DNA-binding transcriptional ArsR family regulator